MTPARQDDELDDACAPKRRARDHHGRLFIDRDPQLFAVLLQFLRAQTLPAQSYVKVNQQSLLEESSFFSNFTSGTLPLRPHIDIRPPLRRSSDQVARVEL